MRIFLTGATGFIGSAIVPELLDAGHTVICLTRSDEAARLVTKAGAQALQGHLRDADSLRQGARAADAVIHAGFDHNFAQMAASSEVDRRAIEAIGEAIVGTNKRFIITSGLPPLNGKVATENDLLPSDNFSMPRQSEQVADRLIKQGIQAMVIRMSQCHNEMKQGFASYLLAYAQDKGMSAFVGNGLNRWPAIHRLDAARLYRNVVEKGVPGQRYHAVAEEGVPVRETAQAIAVRLDIPVVSLPSEESGTHFGWLDRIARMDVPASSYLTQDRLAWRPSESAGLISDIRQATLPAN